VYYETVQRSLDPGETEEVAFPDWVAQPIGRYGTMCFTGLDTDRDRSNDTAYCSTGDSVIVLLPERHDVAVLSLLAPAGRHDSGAVVTPQAVVANVGTRDEEFPITFRIGSGYSQTVQRALSPGEQDTVSFADWTASPPGQLVTTCFTGLANDRNRANDTVSGEVTVDRVDDVGAQLVLAPSGETKLPEGILATTVTPKARITNYGPRPEANFEVLFRIDSLGRDSTVIGVAYERRDTVTQVIEPGASIEVEFPEAQLGLGEYAVACSTMLGTDRRPENDKASGYCRIAARVSGTTDGELEAVIYTRAGERVRGIKRSIQNGDPMLVQWDGMNDKGHACAPGIYICRLQFAPLQGTTEHQFFKLLVTTDFAGMVLTWRWQ